MRADDAKYYVLGVRAEPTAFHWAVVSGTSHTPVLEDSKIEAAPSAYTEGESLSWIRDRILQIIDKQGKSGLFPQSPKKIAFRSPQPRFLGVAHGSWLFRRQGVGLRLGPPSPWSTFEDVTMVQEAVQHDGDSREQFSAVLDGLLVWLPEAVLIYLHSEPHYRGFSQVSRRVLFDVPDNSSPPHALPSLVFFSL
jgi:hypothetical protein